MLLKLPVQILQEKNMNSVFGVRPETATPTANNSPPANVTVLGPNLLLSAVATGPVELSANDKIT